MKKKYTPGTAARSRYWLVAALAIVVAAPTAHAQTTPSWTAALAASQPYSGNATALASVADASGNVYVTGNFTGQMVLGATTLVSAGGGDVFVAKWNAAAGTWAWAVRAGGKDFDSATALALSGTTLYLTGYVTDDAAGGSGVRFGTQALPGKNSGFSTQDLFVAKLTDAGSTATFGWALNGGGGRDDQGTALAVSGGSVYVTGRFTNNAANEQTVTFGALPLNGLSVASSFDPDVVVGKIADAGTTASWGWVQAAGGTAADQATGLAVSGSSVYVAGVFNNSATNANAVTFGAAGVLNGQSASAGDDIFVAKLTDAGSTGAFAWAQAAGGNGTDRAQALAASGSSVYLAGSFTNNNSNGSAVTFGAAGTLGGVSTSTGSDIFVAKLTDAGSTGAFTWAQAGGGLGNDQANALALNGTALYVGGSITNDAPNNNAVAFGPVTVNGVTTTTSADAVVARLTDAGSSATWNWAQAGGGASSDGVNGLAVSGSSVYPVGNFSVSAGFGTATGSPVVSGVVAGDFFVGQLTEAAAGSSAAWARLAQAQVGGAFSGLATAPDASGNVYVAGNFTGRVTLGNTTITSAGGIDAFVAKWSPATGTWLWALPAGGLGGDQAAALAVSGSTVYVAGYLTEDGLNSNLTRFGPTVVNGQSASLPSQDAFVAKLVDAGTSASWAWVQVGGGAGVDRATGLGLNGSSVYVTGYFSNGTSNANAVTFGSTSLLGFASFSSNDAFVAKLTDAGTTGSFTWVQAAGGTGADQATALAVNGSSIYVAGYFTNNVANANAVTFGAATVAGLGATAGNDAFVTKLTDAGTSATFAWTQAAGGTSTDQALALALNGTSVYVAGYATNNVANGNAVTFGTTALPGLGASNSQDAFVAKLTDAGATASFAWAQAGGGTSLDQATALAASGTAVYVAGYAVNTAANANAVTFGGVSLPGSGTTANPDVFLTKYLDAGSTASVAWAQRAGSDQTDQATGLAVRGARLYLTGFSLGVPAFGALTLANPYATQLGFGALLNDTSSPLATTAAAGGPLAFQLYPNPARTAATVAGLPARATCQVLDVLGRPVATATADATGTATLALPASLRSGVYLVRSGTQAARLTVE